MKEYAKHKVRVWIGEVRVLDPAFLNSGSLFVPTIPNGETYVDWEIEHTEECDKLKYGKLCALDWMLEHDGEGMPEEEGTYLVWVVDDSGFVNNWSHYGWEPEYYITYEKVEDVKD
jgi:hypothetical protein